MPTISGSQVGERNDALVNTSTLAWTYTGDVEEKREQEDRVNRQFLNEIKNFGDKNGNSVDDDISEN
jgi:hypothetical protein